MTDNKRAADDAEREAFEAWEASAPVISPFAAWKARAALSSRADGGKDSSDALTVWRAIAEEAEAVVQRGVKYLLLSEEMCIRLGGALETAPQAECAHKFVPYYEGVQLCEKCKATQAECAPREAQPVAKIDADGDFVWLVHNPKFAEGTEFYAAPTPERADAAPNPSDKQEAVKAAIPEGDYDLDWIKACAPTPERADADTAGAAEYIGPHGRALLDAMASQERADAGKDAALTDEQIRRVAVAYYADGSYDDELIGFARAILAANKGR
jgi:hypothetical protein